MKDFRTLHPMDYLRILRRRWLYAVLAFLLVAGGIGAYAWRMPNVYKSEATVAVESPPVPQDYVRSSDRATPEERIASIRLQVQSRSFLERMIREVGLGYDPNPRQSMEALVEAVGQSITVVSTSRSTFRISYYGANPENAQKFVRTIVEKLIQAGNTSRKTRAEETDDFLDSQLRQSEEALLEHEQKIKEFKTRHLGRLPEQSNGNMNALTGLHSQLVSIENALQQARERQKLLDLRSQEQSRLSALTRSIAPAIILPEVQNAPPANPKLQAKEAELAALRSKYTPNHPDVARVAREVEELKKQEAADRNALLEQEKAAESKPPQEFAPEMEEANFEDSAIKLEAESIRSEIAKREKEKAAILAQIRSYQAKLDLAPAIEQEMMALSRDHEVLRKQYENLTAKKFQAEMTANLEKGANQDTYKIIDEANLPETPAFPNRVQIILMGIGAGFVLGIAAAFGRELLDTTLGSESEAAAVLKLPVLVSIAEISARESRKIGRGKMAKSA